MSALVGLALCAIGDVSVGCAVAVGCNVAVGCSVGVVCAVAVGCGVAVAGVALSVIGVLALITCDVGCTVAGAVLFSTTSILSQVTLIFT